MLFGDFKCFLARVLDQGSFLCAPGEIRSKESKHYLIQARENNVESMCEKIEANRTERSNESPVLKSKDLISNNTVIKKHLNLNYA